MTTMVDIARRAGVALSTVSHTLSGKRPVSPEVRERVLRAMEELDYQPHALGQALRNKRTRTIGMLFPSLASGLSTFQLDFVSGAAEIATKHGYAIYLWPAPDQDQEILRMVRQGFIDGLILMEVKLDDPRIAMLKERNYPFVMIGHARENEGISFVDLDFERVLSTCVEHLAKEGHRHIAFLNTRAALERGMGYAMRSLRGFEQRTAELGLQGKAYACPPNAQEGYEFIRSLLAEQPSLSAIVSINAWIAGSIIRAVYEHGLKIPDDFSVIAIMPPKLAEMMVPSFSAIDFPYAEMGRTAAELLIRQLEEENAPATQILLHPPLTIRQSTGPFRDRHRQGISL